jgi:hypothetical protein
VLACTCVLIHCAAGAGDVIQGCCQGSRHTLHPHIQKAGTPDGTAAQSGQCKLPERANICMYKLMVAYMVCVMARGCLLCCSVK